MSRLVPWYFSISAINLLSLPNLSAEWGMTQTDYQLTAPNFRNCRQT